MKDPLLKAMQCDTLISVLEAAALFSVSDQKVRDWIAQGRIKAWDYNKGTGQTPFIRISLASLRDFAEQTKLF